MHLKLVGVGFQSDFTATVEFVDSGAFNFNDFMEIIYGLNNFNFIETKQVQNIIVFFFHQIHLYCFLTINENFNFLEF